MPMKVVFIFNDGGAGWSETHYIPGGSEDPDAHLGAATTLATARAKGLVAEVGSPVTLEAIRITNVNRPNVSGLFGSPAIVRDANSGNPSGMMGARTANLRAYSANKLHSRAIQVRGLPAAWLKGNLDSRRDSAMSPALRNWFNQFTDALKGLPVNAAPWALRVRTLGFLQNVPRGVAAANISPAGYWMLTLPNMIVPLTAPTKINITGVRGGTGLKGINGDCTVITAADPVYTINKRPCNTCSRRITSVGAVRRVLSVDYVPFTEIFLVGYSEHKTGRSFFAPPGRHPNKQRG